MFRRPILLTWGIAHERIVPHDLVDVRDTRQLELRQPPALRSLRIGETKSKPSPRRQEQWCVLNCC